MAIDLQTALSGIVFNEAADNLAVMRGEVGLAAWADLPMVDLGAIGADFDFEEPGLHKRVRACLGNLLARSADNVGMEWAQVRLNSPTHYDHDRVYFADFDTSGSTWGSKRGAVVRVMWARHITGGGAIDDAPLYVEGLGMFGIGTDSEGSPAVAFRLFIPAFHYQREDLHPEVESLWRALTERAMDAIVEELLHAHD